MKEILILAIDDLDLDRPQEYSTSYGYPATGLHIASCIAHWGEQAGVRPVLVFVDHEIRRHLPDSASKQAIDGACRGLIEQVLADCSPALIMIAAPYTRSADWAALLARECKQRSPAPVITGGPHATYLAQRLLLAPASPFDAIILGEGESKIKHLIDNFADFITAFDHPGIATRQNPHRSFAEGAMPLTAIPPMRYDLLPENVVRQAGIVVMAGRGCCYNCKFCIESDYWRGSRGMFPHGTVHQELWELAERYHNPALGLGDSQIYFTHPDFKTFCEQVLGDGSILAPDFFVLSSLNFLEREPCALFHRHGGRTVWVGIESFAGEVLKSMDKKVKLGDIASRLLNAKNAGLQVGAFFMFGFPGETRETANKTLALMRRLGSEGLIDMFDPSIFVPYPGLEMFTAPERYGMKPHPSWHDWTQWNRYNTPPVYDLANLSREEIFACWQEAAAIKGELDIRERRRTRQAPTTDRAPNHKSTAEQ